MICERTQEALFSGEPLDADARAHADGCPLCSELARDGAAAAIALSDLPEVPPEAVDALSQAVRSAVQGDRGVSATLSSLSTVTRKSIGLAAAIATVVVTVMVTPRADLAVYPMPRMALVMGVLTVLLVIAVRHGLSPLHESGGPSFRGTLIAALAIPTILSALPPAHWAHAASLAGAGTDLVPRAVACLLFGVGIALPMLWLLRLLDRGGPRNGSREGAAAVAAGLAGQLGLQLHCALTHPAHLLLGHATVALALLGAYVFVVGRLLRT